MPVGRSRASARAQRGKNCGNGAGDAPYPATGSTPAPNATQPDTSRNRPAGAPLRPPVIDVIEELDPTGRIEELDQDSKLDNALHIEELAQPPSFRRCISGHNVLPLP